MSNLQIGSKVTDTYGQEGIVIDINLTLGKATVKYLDGIRVRDIQSLLVEEC